MKYSISKILAIFLLFPLLTGCGTLVRGSKETYRVISEPPGAIAVFSTGELCTTPCAVEKKRSQPFFVKVVKDGYHPHEIRVEEKNSKGSRATMLANMLMFGSVIWESIDRMNGSNKELTPNPSLVKLEPTEFQPAFNELLSEREPALDGGIEPGQSVYR